jgi:hypothetical protein
MITHKMYNKMNNRWIETNYMSNSEISVIKRTKQVQHLMIILKSF